MSIKNLITPAHVRTDVHYFCTFGKIMTEVSAQWVVLFLRARNDAGHGQDWEAFSFRQLERFYEVVRKDPRARFLLNGLSREHLDVVGDQVTVKDSFVLKLASNSELILAAPAVLEDKIRGAYLEVCPSRPR